jgi:hypothetical protein
MMLFLTFALCIRPCWANLAEVRMMVPKYYPVTDVAAAIKSAFGVPPLLLCDGESLQELRLCFGKDLKVILPRVLSQRTPRLLPIH